MKVQEFVEKNLVKIVDYAATAVKEGQTIEKLPDELRKWVEGYGDKDAADKALKQAEHRKKVIERKMKALEAIC